MIFGCSEASVLRRSHKNGKTATPLSYILQAAMGQCSTLPTEGRSATSSHRGESSLARGEEPVSRKQDDKHPHRIGKRNSNLQVQTQNQPSQFVQMHSEYGCPQSRNPEAQQGGGSEPMDEGRDGIPQPPDIATRSRCYKLNLDSDITPQASVYLGPFADTPPPLTYSTSDDSAENASPLQVAIQTAKIFRGITVAKDGTILSQNARATRSNRGAKNKRGEKSRQATKIEKAKDLVEETIQTGKVSNLYIPENVKCSRNHLNNSSALFFRLQILTSQQT